MARNRKISPLSYLVSSRFSIRKAGLTLFLIIFLILLYNLIGEFSATPDFSLKEQRLGEAPPGSSQANRRLLGVDPQLLLHFRSAFLGNVFRCVSSGEEFPISHVNDDYCDCKDGSDEPATAACSFLLKHKFFFCPTTGNNARNKIPSAWVDDGICDCCDGADEGASEKVKCPRRCGGSTRDLPHTSQDRSFGDLRIA
jgi:hypothetical protein